MKDNIIDALGCLVAAVLLFIGMLLVVIGVGIMERGLHKDERKAIPQAQSLTPAERSK